MKKQTQPASKKLPSFIKGNDKVIAKVTFEDEGQDFTEFTIEFYPDYMLGYVVDCQPAQASIWVGMAVLSDKPKKGKHISVSKSPKDPVIDIKYKITNVEIETPKKAA